LDPSGLLSCAFLVLIPFSVFRFLWNSRPGYPEKLTVGRALPVIIDLHQ
jgi:hypothetical protein